MVKEPRHLRHTMTATPGSLIAATALMLAAMLALTPALTRAEDAAAPPLPPPAICVITGHVEKVENVALNPWGDGTPTVIADSEKRVFVVLEQRTAHTRTPNAPCTAESSAGRTLPYKLCSPVELKPGDRIRATEGAAPLAKNSAICLFDISVLAAQ